MQTSAFKVTEKWKSLWMFFINLKLPEDGRLFWPFLGNFHKISAENPCNCTQIRSEQILAGVTVLRHCMMFQGGTKLLWKSTSKWDYAEKGRSGDSHFYNIEKLSIRSSKTTRGFLSLKSTSKKAPWSCVDFPSIEIITKMFIKMASIKIMSKKHVEMMGKLVGIDVLTYFRQWFDMLSL